MTACGDRFLPVRIGNTSRFCRLSATRSESEVELALSMLEEAATLPTLSAVRELVDPVVIPQVVLAPVNLSPYDALLPSRRQASG